MRREVVLVLVAAVLAVIAGDAPAVLQPTLRRDAARSAAAPAELVHANLEQAQGDDEGKEEHAETTLPASKCHGKSCQPLVTHACKGRMDGCSNETDCCEIDKCNIWQHVGRDVAVVLVFYVKWCPVSRDFMLTYDLLREKFAPFSDVLVAKVDADQSPNLVGDFGVEEFPAVVYFRHNCYWSGSGCYDQEAHFRFDGPSNEFEVVDAWIAQQLTNEVNDNAFKALPETPESLTGCHVSKVTQLPDDMRERLSFPEDEGKPLLQPEANPTTLLQLGEGARLRGTSKQARRTCRLSDRED